MIGSLEYLQGEEGDVNDNFLPVCYCPGHEYASHFPELPRAISKVFREKSREAKIYRVPVPRQSKLPSIDVLKGIKKFSNYTRSQLLDITDEDLDILEEKADQAVAKSQQMNNDTRTKLEQTYLELQQEMQDFNYNMSLRKQIIAESQEAVRNPSNKRRRKREGFSRISTFA